MTGKRIRLSVAGFMAAIMLTSAPALADQPTNPGDSNPHDKVTLCHATKSESNPFVQITVNANGSASGHAGNSHQDGQDIIPPFDYNDDGTVKHFTGQNWDTQGQAIFNNGCKVGGQGGGTTGTTTTTNQVATNLTQAQVAGRGQAAAPQAVAAQGGVAAGAGGAKVTSAGAIVGLVASVGTVASGLAFAIRKF